MTRRVTMAVLVGATLVGIAAWRVLTPPPARAIAANRPNVVLVIGCTVRRDQLTPYGGPDGLTPFLSETAAKGVSFADGITSAPWTKPASTAIVTGHDAVSIGMVEPTPALNRRVLAPEVTTLAEWLKSAGYATYGLTANPNLNAVFGFDQGFDGYFEASGTWASGDMVKVSGEALVDQALTMLAEAPPEGPVYLQIMILDTHAPYGTAPAETERWAEPGLPERVAKYRGALARFDRSVRRLHDGLAGVGLTDANTVFVVVNDHGEGMRFPPHHGVAHGKYLYESTVGMVWLARGYGVAAGRVVEGLASQVDVVPTVLGMLGLPGYAGPGMDFSTQLRGQSDRTPRERAYTDTWFKKQERSAVYTETAACHEDFAGVAEGNPLRVYPACYDRRTDRHAERALAAPPEDLLADVRAWHAARAAELAAWGSTRDATVGEGTLKELEALGYMGGDE